MTPAKPRRILISRVNFLWYLAPIIPILALFYAGIAGYLPNWMALIAIFAFFMWLFSLVFTVYAVLMRRLKERKK